MSAPAPALIAEVTRRDRDRGAEWVESTHVGHVVVVGPDGEVVASLGDPDRITFVRSSVKIQQARAAVGILAEAGRAHELTSADLAIGQSSHRGEPQHLDAVRALLSRSGTAPDALTTPVAVAEADPGGWRARIRHECSGKHALFAAAGRVLGVEGSALLDPGSALQKRILAHLEDELGPFAATTVDGCGAPAVAVPLVRLAASYQRLRTDPGYASLVAAGIAHPLLVGGEGRPESALLAHGVTAKSGAEGLFAVAWTDRDGRAWGLAVKAEDGATRGCHAAVLGLLTGAGAVPAGIHEIPPPLGGRTAIGSVRTVAAVVDLGEQMRGR